MKLLKHMGFVMGLSIIVLFAIQEATSQPGSGQRHLVNQTAGNPKLVPANVDPPGPSRTSITVEGGVRVIESNGLPNHLVGRFPNSHNPNTIAPQRYKFDMSANPKPGDQVTRLGLFNFGLAVNGVPFDPSAAEWYKGDPDGGWRYAPLSGAIPLGLDQNYAHVQRSGAYHYHGLPTLLLRGLGLNKSAHSPLVGWAGDGIPIYAVYGYADPDDSAAGVKAVKSSYRVKSGKRPSGGKNPGGTYDGTFIADYEYVSGAGDLDECNGRLTVTPEFPDGTYAYFLSQNWPIIPRCFKDTPSKSFTEQRRRRRRP